MAEEILDFPLRTIDITERDKLAIKETSHGLPLGANSSVSPSEGTSNTKVCYIFGSCDEESALQPTHSNSSSEISALMGWSGVFQPAFTEENAFSLELCLGHITRTSAHICLQNELKEQPIRNPLTDIYNSNTQINECLDHRVGDRVLREVAHLLGEQVRGSDLVVRYGSDEFLVMLIETDGQAKAMEVRIREAVKEKRNETGESFPVPITFSIGTAHCAPKKRESIEQVLARTDKRAYAPKGARRGTG